MGRDREDYGTVAKPTARLKSAYVHLSFSILRNSSVGVNEIWLSGYLDN